MFMFAHIDNMIKYRQIQVLAFQGRSKSYNLVYAPSEDSNQPALPRSLIRVFARHSMGSQGLNDSSYGQ